MTETHFPVMMGCGHAANATTGSGEPACAICIGIDPKAVVVVNAPNLAGREAICSCGKIEPSSTKLAFFEYRGEGSRMAVNSCGNCGYTIVAHERKKQDPTQVVGQVCDNFKPRGAWTYDSFYCGCRGWD